MGGGSGAGSSAARRASCSPNRRNRCRLASSSCLLYLYVHDLDDLHERLTRAGLEPGPIESGAPGPDRQFSIDDPDGYNLMVTEADALTPPAQD